jgi:hypothetical protein
VILRRSFKDGLPVEHAEWQRRNEELATRIHERNMTAQAKLYAQRREVINALSETLLPEAERRPKKVNVAKRKGSGQKKSDETLKRHLRALKVLGATESMNPNDLKLGNFLAGDQA